MAQRTVARSVSCSGIGLHSGAEASFLVAPAPPGSGILLTAPSQRKALRASVVQVQSTRLSTTLGEGSFSIRTVEHLLSALAGAEIDNALVTVMGGEIPIMDGSALPFVSLLREAGSVEQDPPRRVIRLLETLSLEEGEKFIRIRPAESTSISFTIRFDHPAISEQSYTYFPSREAFRRDIAPARTFGFLREVERLRSEGLIRGGSFDNAVVIGEKGILNEQGLRFPDELVRHKILDLIGDFSLLGAPIIGEIQAYCSGHALHTEFLQKLLSSPQSRILEEERQPLSTGLLAIPA